jgi:hypothetical protein
MAETGGNLIFLPQLLEYSHGFFKILDSLVIFTPLL